MASEQQLQNKLAEMEQQLAIHQRRLARERMARKQAERLLESKSQQLYQSNHSLQTLTENLEKQVHERTRELEAEKNHALYLSQIKTEFVATMSHEIRTPLNGIISVLDLLQKNNGHADQQQLLNIASHSSQTLLSIINDILDFSKIEAGQMRLEKVAFDLRQLLKNIFMSFAQKADKKGIELDLNIDSKVPVYIESDPIRLTQILNNYLSNGIKFTEQGSVQLNVIPQGELINFSVCDSGVGIPQEKMDLLFKDFSQVDASTTRKYGGTGLGLVITKRIVEIMDGTVSVSSKLGKGSCFSAIIPLQIASSQQAIAFDDIKFLDSQFTDCKFYEMGDVSYKTPANSKSVGAAPASRNENAHILLVDDNAVNRLIGEKTLHALGFEVTLAPSGFDAIDKLSIMHDYDLVLMDCQMPELSGYDTTKILRGKNIQLPILALTANTSEQDREMAKTCGMNDFISKPFSIKVMQQVLQKHLVEN